MASASQPGRSEENYKRTVMACQVMFGARAHIARPLVRKLHPRDVEVIYRTVVLSYMLSKFHPDREKDQLHTQDLAKWGMVFSLLYNFLASRSRDAVVQDAMAGAAQQIIGSHWHYFCGDMPKRHLNLAEYLYYSRLISKEMMNAAIEWQRGARPLFGQLAISKGYLTPAGFAVILSRLAKGHFFGESACRIGLMTPAQVEEILKAQAVFDRPPEQFFLDRKVLNAEQVKNHLLGLRAHNALLGRPSPTWERAA
jgi:hypothetical protein